MAVWTVPPLWQGGECWIIGGGPSMPRQFHVPEEVIADVCTGRSLPAVYSPYLASIHDKHVIGINNSYQIGYWIDIVFFGDCSWYLVHRTALAKFPGMKVSCCARFMSRPHNLMEGVKYLSKDNTHRQGITDIKSAVAWNNNSGAAAISLAVHLGVKRIVLLGFDMSLDRNSVSHWHGSHHKGAPTKRKILPPFARHLRGFPAIAKDAVQMGVEIINASPDSAIRDFKRCSVDKLLENSKIVVGQDGADNGQRSDIVGFIAGTVEGISVSNAMPNVGS